MRERLRNGVLNIAAFLLVLSGGAVFASLHIMGRILDRIDRRYEAEVMRRLRSPNGR